RPRPAALILPQDLMAATSDPPHAVRAQPAWPQADAVIPTAPPAAIAEAAGLLASAERPIVLAGGGALWSGAAAEVRSVAERLNAPVITTLNGRGLIDERDPISLGHGRSDRARVALEHADAMLAVGCRFTQVMTGWRTMKVPAHLVQIDLAPDQIGVN